MIKFFYQSISPEFEIISLYRRLASCGNEIISSGGMQKVLILTGATGVGKTETAIKLARLLNGEIISCDSVQVYKKLDIGSNKTLTTEQAEIPHHLIDIVDFSFNYTVSDFYKDCNDKIRDILSRGKVPMIVGGTMFYLEWILKGKIESPPKDELIRKKVLGFFEQDADWNTSLKRLESLDPLYAQKLCRNDYFRLERALCVVLQTGKPLTSFLPVKPEDYDFRCFYLTQDRERLYRKIETRCEEMIRKGLIEEVYALMKTGFQETLASKAIGYAATINFIRNFDDTIESIEEYLCTFKTNTRNYCRRQDQYFRKNKEYKWLAKDDNTVRKIFNLFKMNLQEFESEVHHEDTQLRQVSLNLQDRMKTYIPYQTTLDLESLRNQVKEMIFQNQCEINKS